MMINPAGDAAAGRTFNEKALARRARVTRARLYLTEKKRV